MHETICVLGLGYIGLPTALLFSRAGHEVTGVDIKESVVRALNAGTLHIDDPGFSELFAEARSHFIARTEPIAADVFIIAVPTPLDRSVMVSDLSYVHSAAEMIAPHLKEGDLVVLESTVPPGASGNLVIPTLEQSGIAAGQFLYAHCPERAIPGSTLAEMIGNDRIIGGIDERSTLAAVELYRHICTGKFHTAGIRDAEFVKLIENTFRDVNIAFANEIAILAEELGIDGWRAITLANQHPRVNILSPGPGVGGHCIAVDPVFLTESSSAARLVQAARQINDSMPNRVMRTVTEMLDGVRNPRITLLGVSYKAGTPDYRESPAIKLIHLAENLGYSVTCYDPLVSQFIRPMSDLRSAVEGSDCLLLLVDHVEFLEMDPALFVTMRNRNLLDCRNFLDHKNYVAHGFNTRILGNPAASRENLE